MVEARGGGCRPRVSVQGREANCGRAARAAVAAALSGKTSRSGLVVPVGWRETASAALCRTPGICTMRKW